jgi:hypothetical protein
MRILVCGGRDFFDEERAFAELDAIAPTYVIEGGQRTRNVHGEIIGGADFLAYRWASARDVPGCTYDADWTSHGRAAGPIRNQQMIDDGKPDLVVAFPGGRGTADMVRRAKAAGIPVREVK